MTEQKPTGSIEGTRLARIYVTQEALIALTLYTTVKYGKRRGELHRVASELIIDSIKREMPWIEEAIKNTRQTP